MKKQDDSVLDVDSSDQRNRAIKLLEKVKAQRKNYEIRLERIDHKNWREVIVKPTTK